MVGQPRSWRQCCAGVPRPCGAASRCPRGCDAGPARGQDARRFACSSGGGHVTTCVSGSGANAQLVDNIEYEYSNGTIANPANDGSANDIVVSAAHAASEEFSGVNASSVTIYRLDTPIAVATQGTTTLAGNAQDALTALFSVTDANGRSITAYQAYDTNQGDHLDVNGTAEFAYSAATAATATSLSSLHLDTGATTGQDTIEIRAFNGAYWGDWTSTGISNSGTQSTTFTTPTPTPTVFPTPTPTIISPPVAVPSPAAADPAAATAPPSTTAPVTPEIMGVYRFFDTTDGTHFFTASATERDGLIATRPDLTYEGVGINSVQQSTTDPNVEAVFRFFDMSTGNHFYTASTTERDGIIAGNPGLSYEGTAFYEHATQEAGDSAVYRFFDTIHGTHLYTEDPTERASILATRPDLTPEGIAYYAPSLT